jgi:hypothetical protein
MYALVRDARAQIQNVQASVAEIRAATALTDPISRQVALAAALLEAGRVVPASWDAIAARFAAIDALLDEHPEVGNYFRDWIVYAENAWLRAQAAWPSNGLDANHPQPQLDHLDRYLNEAVYWCGYISIPSRLRETMQSLRIGQPLDFQWAFQEELPGKPERDRILLEISRQPLFLPNGVVDLRPGVVYRIAEEPRRRVLSLVRIGAAALLGFAIAIVWSNVGQWLRLNGWSGKPEDWKPLCAAYLFLLLGSSAHVLVNALKERRAQPDPGSFIALDDWIVWAHIREHSILWSVVYLWCGLIMLAWTHSLDWRTAFFAGYSIDSVIDLFLQRFQKVSAEGVAAAKLKLAQ